MSGSIRVCAGALGTPAEGYGGEVEFIQAALVVDYDRRAPEAVAALGDAADRLAKESEAFHLQRRAAFDARVRLDVHLSGDARQVEFTTLRPTSDQSMTIDPGGFDRLRCREFITRALDGGSLPPGSAARVTASKRVQYRVIRCVLDAVEDAGVARDDISFSIDRAP